jgi:trimeric autotransporter adhesin
MVNAVTPIIDKSPRWPSRISARALLRGCAQAALVVGSVASHPMVARAMPAGGVVSGGSARIASSGKQLTITQDTDRAVLDWSSFNIAQDEAVKFVQPGASSVALNRIHDQNPTQIEGQLSANGQVWLLNPNGVMFGKNAQVDVAGLVATSSDIDNSAFMAGSNRFTHAGAANATVQNDGQITIKDAGMAAFVAPSVINNGTINARLGKVALASGDTFAVDMYGDGLVSVEVSPQVAHQLVSNTGTISAQGGVVQMTAAQAANIVDTLVTNSGAVMADAAGVGHNGEIILYAAGGNVTNSGTLTASGKGTGQTGGSVTVTGNTVDLASTSVIDASGDAGGGYVKIGGDFHGQGSTFTATTTIVEAGSTINASAITSGDGGKVAVWSDDATWFAGDIQATGGAQSGNGGFIETSGHVLAMHGTGSASAPHGTGGTWLLDPNDVTIDANATSNPSPFTPNWTSTGTSDVYYSDIESFLNAGTSVTITASGNITVGHTVTKTAGVTDTLTLAAGGNIIQSSAISGASGFALNVILDANSGNGASGYILSSANITTYGGDIWMGGGALDGSGHPTGTAYGNNGSYFGIEVNGTTLNAAGGNITMNGTGYASTTSSAYGLWLTGGSTVRTSGTGNISITGAGGSGTAVGEQGVVLYVGSNTISNSGIGSITITGIGGTGTGGSNRGITLFGFSGGDVNTITNTGGGAITLIGVAGGGGSSYGLITSGPGSRVIGGASDTGNITLVADSVFFNVGTSIQTSGNITVKEYTAGTTIGLDGGAGTLGLTSTYLGYFTWGSSKTLTIGDSSAGNITANADASRLNVGSVTLLTGGNITLAGAWSKSSGSTDTFTLSAAGNITLGSYAIGGASGYALNVIVDSGNAGASNAITGIGNITTYGGDIWLGGGALDGSGHPTGYSVGTSSSGSQYGLYLNAVTLNAGGGNISLMGKGGTYTSGGDDGIYVHGSTTQTSGTGTITLTGQGGTSTSGTNYGVYLDKATAVGNITSTGSGTISITGIMGSGGTNYGIGTDANSDTISGSGYSGNITLTADTVSFGTGTAISTTGNMTIAPYTTTTAVATGGSTTSSTSLALTDTYLGYLSGESSLTIGNANDTGTLTLNAHSGWNAPVTFLTKNTGAISVAGDQTATGSGSLTFTGGPVALTGNITTANQTIAFNPAVTLGQDDTIIAGSGNVTFGAAVNGGHSITVSAGNISLASAWGGGSALSAVSLTSAGGLSLPSITASSILARTTGAAADLTLNNGTTLTASASGTAITLAAGRNLVNNSNSAAVSTPSGRWLIYSANPASDTDNGLTASFDRYSCTYGGSCPSFASEIGNGMLYSYTPTLTLTPSGISLTYGDAAPNLTGYGYGVTGYLNNAHIATSDASRDSVTGSLTGSTTYTQGSSAGSYNVNYTSGALASALGYAFTYANNATAITVNAKALTAALNGAAEEKTYDGTLSASLGSDYSLTGVLAGDVNNINLSATGTYDTKNAGSSKTVTFTGLSLGGSAASNYTLSTVSLSDANGLIDKAALTVSSGVSANNKVYDSTTSGSLSFSAAALSGVIAGDVGNVSVNTGSAYTATFASANVANGIGLTVSSLGLSGSAAGNYTLTQPTGLTANITPASLTVTAKNVNMTYADGTTFNTSTGFTTSGLLGSDAVNSVSLATNATTSTSLNWNAGTWTITPSAASGTGLSNYTISYSNASTGLTVSKASLSITGVAATNKVYDGTLADTLDTSSEALAGKVSGDVVTISDGTGAFGDKNVGAGKAVTASGFTIGGHDAGNYLLTGQPAALTADITKATVTITADNKAKTFGDTDPSLTYTYGGLATGDTTGIFSGGLTRNAGETVGNYTINQGTLSAGGNYNITYTPGTLTISALPLIVVVADDKTKVYGAILPTLTYQASGFVNGDTAATVLTGTLATTATQTSSVGTYNITQGTLAANSNYTLTFTGGTLTVTAAPLTITAKNIGMVYADGTILNTSNGFTVSGLLNSDAVNSVNLATNATLASSGNWNVSSGTPWVITASTAAGTGLSNYTISYVTGTQTVTPKSVTITGVLATNKTYDATTSNTLDTTGEALSGKVSGDNLSISNGIGTFTTAGAGTGITVNASGFSLTGNDIADYSLTSQPAGLSATINKATLTVTPSDATRTAGDSNPTFTGSITGFVGGESASVLAALPTYSTSAGASSPAGAYAITAYGGLANNYTFNYLTGTLTISAAITSSSSGLGSVPNNVFTRDIATNDAVPLACSAGSQSYRGSSCSLAAGLHVRRYFIFASAGSSSGLIPSAGDYQMLGF